MSDRGLRPFKPATGRSTSPGWVFFGYVGWLFAVVGATDLLLAMTPFHFGNPEWEFGTAAQVFDGLPVLTFGLVLVLAGAAQRGSLKVVQLVALLCGALGIALLLLAGVYALNVPIAFNNVVIPVARTGLKRAAVKMLVEAIAYPFTYLLLAYGAWRHSRAAMSGAV